MTVERRVAHGANDPQRLVEAGQLLDVALLDHVIIGRNRYVSLKERGLGFK